MEVRAVAGKNEPEKVRVRWLSGQYRAAFAEFVGGGGESALERAYEIGRTAIDSGLGVLAIAGIHEDSLKSLLISARSPGEGARIVAAAENFFSETLAPFEMAQRGYRQANYELKEVNRTLESRVAERTEELRKKDRAIRKAYIDVIYAVTGGKLVITTDDEVSDALGEPLTRRARLGDYAGISGFRAELAELLGAKFPTPAVDDMVLAVDEALANAVKHAGGGFWQVFNGDSCVQVLIDDDGPGIDFSALPKATLMAGYSTAKTLGVGFSVMLEYCDRVLLATRPGRTTIVLEMEEDGVRERTS